MIKKKLQLNKYKELKEQYERKVNKLSNMRLITFIIMLLSFILKHYYYELLLSIIFTFSLITFIILILIHDKYYKIYDYYNRYLDTINNYIKRTNGEWKNFEDTGIEYLEGDKLELSRLDDVLVINGQNTGISFYKSAISYDKVTHSDNSKTMDYHLEVSYVLGAKTFTTSNVDTSNLNDVEKEVIDASVLYFTELIENSIGVNKSAFALLIVSSVVETLLIGACVFGIVALKRSKED